MTVRGLLRLASNYPAYREIVEQLSAWQRGTGAWLAPSLPVAARSFLLAALQADLRAPLLVITPRADDARHLHEQLLVWSAHAEAVLLYPDPDTLPYERTPAGDLSGWQRMAILARLSGLDVNARDADAPHVVVSSVRAALHQTLALRDLAANSRVLRRGQRVAMNGLRQQWLRLGYEPATLVEQPGQMSHRGGIVDIFPVTSREPVRLEFFGDEIDSLRRFDPATQRSTAPTDAVTITPPAEVLPEFAGRVADTLEALDLAGLNSEVAQQWELDRQQLRQGVSGAQARELWHFYAAYFHAHQPPATLLDHFDGLIVLDGMQQLALTAGDLEAEAAELKTGKLERGEITRDFAVPFMPWRAVEQALSRRPRLVLDANDADAATGISAHVLPALPFSPSPIYGGRLKQVLDDCQREAAGGASVVLTSHQAKRLSALLRERDAIITPVDALEAAPPPGSLTIVQGSVGEGWRLGDDVMLLTDVEIFGWAKPRRSTAPHRAAAQALLSDLAVGDYVVHIEHGVGIFRGLVKLNLDGAEREYLHLDYAQHDRLFVPTDKIDRVSRYVGVGETSPALTTLGSADWEHAKRRARTAVQDVAKELLAIYAARQVAPGAAFSPDNAWQSELEASFPYIETPDQLRSINEVKIDMERQQPMDRLICGDVGYGKTEVALRAAFKAVMDSKQVAILVPTTILAQQHYNTFRERLAAFPVRVDMLSRFRSHAAQRQIIERLGEGGIDICIGTHRLIQKDVAFKNLGLVIIDEEQRFGVMHKERLKKLRQEVDVLTLTATPIPRTLHLSLVGVRDMSVIDTPPEDRLPITTVVSSYDENVIRQAIMRELDRGGQVYFVHNRVQSIEHVTHRLQSLLPHVSFAIGHGQMPEEQLARVMTEFAAGDTDVLVCTAIIESGVDIPNVNTIIINRADQFGLAQLYQLRGRVGRGASRAYAYLLHDRSYQLSETAEQRLKAIFEASSLGAGYRIAMKDLEIRGAGNILGVEQHGHIAAIGFDLYTRLLASEVQRLKEEGLPDAVEETASIDLPSPHPSVTLPVDAFIPVSYVEDDSTRLALYQRMAGICSIKETEDMRHELTDRFGKPPPSVESLLYVLDTRARAEDAGVASIAGHDSEFVLHMQEGRHLDAARLVRLLGPALKVGSSTVRFDRRKAGGRWREYLRSLLDALAQNATS
jgi:transcription-repair coupling factor (superfamily II helicase)